ncbi:MAG: A/G-specific adenine glycosylase [Planctomycetes bacterium]|nr:A/G-specific adenine glycosylase [Planctomycetota bacterium]
MGASFHGFPGLDRPAIRRRLMAWYRRTRRDLPWRRREGDGYAQLLAEFMLQQTQVATVVGYFERFLSRFPAVTDLARADVGDVLALWSGLGYYRRARNLHAAARQIVEEHEGVVPRDVKALMRLPGVGRYTAGAIASIAYGTRAAVLDGNVARVLMRLLAIDDDPKSPVLRQRLWQVAESLVPTRRCGDFNQGLMELGATLCRPNSPACVQCPLRRECGAHALGLTGRIPRPGRRASVRSVEFVVAAIRRGRRLLFARRPLTGLWAGLWELPSEPVRPGESPRAARDRLRKRLLASCRLSVTPATHTTRQLTHRRVTLHVYMGGVAPPASTHQPRRSFARDGRLPAKRFRRSAGSSPCPARWLEPSDLPSVGISRATHAVLKLLSF